MSILHRAFFKVSAAKTHQLPIASIPEICFVGRSNSGKSSAINVLTQQRRLAFSSKTPGRTRLINLFSIPNPDRESEITELAHLVDLPGYGYASVAREEKENWAEVLGDYLLHRESLIGIVLMIDIRRGLTDLDKNLLRFVEPTQTPLLVLMTKADKFPYGQRIKAQAKIRQELKHLAHVDTLPFSSTHRLGIDEATSFLENWILNPTPPDSELTPLSDQGE